jgi:hypothetical protein
VDARPFTFTVNPAGSPPGVTTRVAFCEDDAPLWVAVQNGDGAWARATEVAPRQFDVTIGDRGAIATVTRGGGGAAGYDLDVTYLSGAEVAYLAQAGCGLVGEGSKKVTGTVANLGGRTATASLGGAFGFAGADGAFTIGGVASGALTLVAARSDVAAVPDRVIVRRGVDALAGSALPTLDFEATEAFAPATATLTVGNRGGDDVAAVTSLYSGRAGGGFLGVVSGGAALQFAGVPGARLDAGEFNTLSVGAAPADGSAQQRVVYQFFRDVADRTVTLGAALATATVTTTTGAPYLRPRLQLPSQGDYGALVSAVFSQGSGGTARSASVTRTAAYGGAVPASWELTLPDFSAVAGFDAGWAPQNGAPTAWTAAAYGGAVLTFLGDAPSDGASYRGASRAGALGGRRAALRAARPGRVRAAAGRVAAGRVAADASLRAGSPG